MERLQSISTSDKRRSVSGHKPGLSRTQSSKLRQSITGRGGHREAQTIEVKVLDEHGIDVTPKPLLGARVINNRGTGNATGTSTPNSEASVADFMDGRMSSAGFSLRGSHTFDRSATASPEQGGDAASDAGSVDEGRAEKDKHKEAPAAPAVSVWVEDPPSRPEDFERGVHVYLRETETFFLIDMPARCVQVDSAEAAAVKERNESYKQLLRRHAEGEVGTENSSQTLIFTSKSRDVQTAEEPPVDMGCQTSDATIYDDTVRGAATDAGPSPRVPGGEDAHAVSAEALAAGVTTGSGSLVVAAAVDMHTPPGQRPSSSMSMADARRMSTMSSMSMSESGAGPEQAVYEGGAMRVGGGGGDGVSGVASGPPAEEAAVPLSSFRRMGHALSIMERAVLQNQHHDRLLMYRGYRLANAALMPTAPRALVHLWDFSCDAVGGRNVACMALNPAKEDLLAVAYGEYAFLRQRPGLVAFWSLKNPKHPLWYFEVPCGVTAVDFSTTAPNLLAVGRYDGTVAIYDVRQRGSTPMMESTLASGQHSDPVWNLKWVRRGNDNAEEWLISVSTDGRVVQWSIAKGLEHIELMNLKQAINGAAAPKKEAIVSRRAPGMCFDFSPRDSGTYLVGTEDGGVHRCSVSDSEQYLGTYNGHGGPIYAVRWAPYADRLFLSASADGTARLWREESDDPLLTFQSEDTQGEVADVAWSKTNGTVFGSVTTDGRLEIWDVSESVLKPSLTHIMDGYRLSCIMFAEGSPVVLVGNDSGSVSVFRMVGVENEAENLREQPYRLREALSGHVHATS